jgi:hypothetical protein
MTIGMLGACYFKTNPYIIGMSQGSDARERVFLWTRNDFQIQPGWWFQTFLFSIIYGIILPID